MCTSTRFNTRAYCYDSSQSKRKYVQYTTYTYTCAYNNVYFIILATYESTFEGTYYGSTFEIKYESTLFRKYGSSTSVSTEVVLPYVLFMKVGGSFVQSTCARTTYDRIHVRPHVKRGV